MSEAPVIHRLEDSIKVVEVLRRTASGHVAEASVRDARAAVSVVVRQPQTGEWEPVYGLKDGETIGLPHCFSLNADCLKALDLTS